MFVVTRRTFSRRLRFRLLSRLLLRSLRLAVLNERLHLCPNLCLAD